MLRGRGALIVAVMATLAVARVGIAPAEQCPEVTVEDARRAAAEGVGWFEANQRANGQWAYLVSRDGEDLGDYNIVRHAGVLLSLYQAVGADVEADTALEVAERGLEFVDENLEPVGDGVAFVEPGAQPRSGGSALLILALMERRDVTGETDRDELLVDLGRFLLEQVEPSGALLSAYQVPGDYSKYATGQALWGFIQLEEAFPGEGFGEAADRILAYLPDRDDEEDLFPPTADHWAAYALGELGEEQLDERSERYARHLAGLFGLQVRVEATKWDGGVQGWARGGPASGSGVGTLGEGGAALLRAVGEDDVPGMAERVRCVAGMLVHRQVDDESRPAVDGAWFTDGQTRMDDQQHIVSALLAAEPSLESGDVAVGGGEEAHGWLWVLVAAVAVANPAARGRTDRRVTTLAIAGGAVVVAVLSGPLLDAVAVSPASARPVAAAAAAIAAVLALFRGRARWRDGLLLGAWLLVALSVGADDGVLPVAVGAAVVAGVALALDDRWRRPLVTRPLAVLALLAGVDLLLDGIFAV